MIDDYYGDHPDPCQMADRIDSLEAELAQLHCELLVSAIELADERGDPRPGEQVIVELLPGFHRQGFVARAAESLTGISAHGSGPSAREACQAALTQLRHRLISPAPSRPHLRLVPGGQSG